MTRSSGRAPARIALPGGGIHTTILLWPVGYPLFGPNGGPPAYVDNLGTGRLSLHSIPGITGGDFQPYLVSVGRWLVYPGNGGVSAIPDDLRGSPRVLGTGRTAAWFVPSAAPDRVWLVEQDSSGHTPSVRSVRVSGGKPGPAVRLPRNVFVVRGTDAGLLLLTRRGELELWTGRANTTIARVSGIDAGFASTARLIAFGTGCRIQEATVGYPNGPVGYDVCRTLNVVDVVTDARFSMTAPSGTIGWVPRGFGTDSAIAPATRMLAAEAAVAPARAGKIRVFVLALARRVRRPMPIPLSTAAPLYASMAWSVGGSWVFYEGPGARLRALQVTTGRMRSYRTPCCAYTVMVTVPSSPGH